MVQTKIFDKKEMNNQHTNYSDRILDWAFNCFESGTNKIKTYVDSQIFTHVLLAFSLWFVIIWLKNSHPIFYLCWILWFWYVIIVGTGIFRKFYEN